MNKLFIKSESTRLNFFQRIRLQIYKKQKFSMERYEKAPDYIKSDISVYGKIINNPELCIEENLLQIPEEQLINSLRSFILDLDVFSIDKQIELINKYPDLMPNDFNKVRLIIDTVMEKGEYSFIEILDYQMQKQLLDLIKGNKDKLSYCLKYLKNSHIADLIRDNKELIKCLDIEQQIEFAKQNNAYFKYVDEETQLKYIQNNPEYIVCASYRVQKDFVKLDIKNFDRTSEEFQKIYIAEIPELYKYAGNNIKRQIWKDSQDKLALDTRCSLLKEDIRNIKKVDIEKEGIEPSLQIFDNIENQDIEVVKNLVLHSKLMSAKGKLVQENFILHNGAGGEQVHNGVDDYSINQVKVLQKLNIEQIKQLILIDSNYVLPYLVSGKGEIKFIINEADFDVSKLKCKNIFRDMFGTEMLNELEECVDIVYNLQAKSINKSYREFKNSASEERYKEIMDEEKIPLNNLKILFNEKIISKNSVEDLKKYFFKLKRGENIEEEFNNIIKNAYGEKAVSILESRPGLDAHNLNSLEVFDERIIENFGAAFVHDLISYNIRDFSEFLDVIKDKNKLENFKIYYQTLTNVMGANVETMQKAISEYNYNGELLNNVKDRELTDSQYDNLISVLCSKNNKYNINTLEDLEKFEEISNNMIIEELQQATTAEERKSVICESFLGINSKENYKTRNYGDSLEYLSSFYDILGESKKGDIFDKSEQKILEVINIIDNVLYDERNTRNLVNELFKEPGIKNPVAIYSTINKMKEHEIEILNESLLTPDKMKEMALNEMDKDNPLIYMEEEEGIIKYVLQGIDYNFLAHDTYGASIQSFGSYEGQFGNNAICARLATNKINNDKMGKFIFTSVEKQSGVIAYDDRDANTNHLPKLVRGTSDTKRKINSELTNNGNEVAIYRRLRDHSNISNENAGGRRLPDLYRVESNIKISTLDDETKEFLRENGIPIIYIDFQKYEELNRQNQQLERQEISIER